MTYKLSYPVDGVALIQMACGKVNAQGRVFRDDMTNLFDKLGSESDTRAIILTGNGRVFSAGADLKDRPSSESPGAFTAHNRSVRGLTEAVLTCSVPVVAAIDGPAIGAGLGLASACDIIVISEEAWVSMPEVQIGMAGGVRHLMRHFHPSDARLLMLTGRKVSGSELYRMGVASSCVPEGSVVEEALGIAGEIANAVPEAVEAAKKAFFFGEELSVQTGYRYEQLNTVALSTSDAHSKVLEGYASKESPGTNAT